MNTGSEVSREGSRDGQPLNGYSHPAGLPPGFAPITSPETPATPFTGRGSSAFLLQSPSQSSESASTYASPGDPYKLSPTIWAPTAHGIDAQTNHPGSGVVEQSELIKGPGLNISSTSLPPNKPRPSRASWLRAICLGKWSMVLLLILGVGLAIGHHFFFQSLNGKEATNQMRYTRLGSIFSISAKSCLVVATILAYHQRAWMVVQQKVHSVRAVDTLFGAAENFMHLLSLTMLRNDLACLILALFVWTSPLIIIFSADTLSIELMTRSENATCPSIRTLNFNHEGGNDWAKPRIPANQSRIALSVSTWNATRTYAERNESDPNFWDYWTASSKQFSTVASTSLWGKRPMMYEKASSEVCGTGWNCSATISFVAPGYKCEELGRGRGSTIKELDGRKPPFNFSQLAPEGPHSYFVHASEGAYPPQYLLGVEIGGMPNKTYKEPYPKILGAFRTDPVIWVGYTEVNNVLDEPPTIDNTTGWKDTSTPVMFGCVHHRTNYTIKFNWIAGGGQTYEVLDREYLNKTIDTRYLRNNQTRDARTYDITHATPESNYILPQNRWQYRVTAAYYSMGARLREMINGTVAIQGQIANTEAINTRLIDPHYSLPVKNLQEKLGNMYEDLIVSLINNPQFMVVSWASNSSLMTGVATGSEVTDRPCQREVTTNCFIYHKDALWAVYSASIAITLIGVILGFLAATRDDRDGELREMAFSEIVSATRGRDLDEVRWDQHMDKSKVKVLYKERPGDETDKFILVDGAEQVEKAYKTKAGRGLGRYSWRNKSEFEYRGNES
ncbi:hypothetical protein B0T10DRAFT_490145 [Thelonectria olida]|uniref:Uncharacterized protein n=1 Tax=Thelonectria olida TaxID=1576542 RepID=A0A9P9AN77_9HYPO|nr:hypothetical protein B0T10DRAFT_490145 [Thelonectria olida]